MKIPLCLIAAAVILAGCKTQTPVAPVREVVTLHDTVRSLALHVDSVTMRDSVALFIRGDTVYHYRERERTRLKVRVDTVHHHDVTTRVATRRVEVERSLSTTQRLLINTGRIALLLLGGLAVAGALRLYHRWRKH